MYAPIVFLFDAKIMNDNRKRYLERREYLRENPPPPRIVNPKGSKGDNMDDFNIITVCSFFMGCFLIFFQFESLDLSLFGLIKFYALFVGISFLIPIKLYRKKLTMSFYEYLLFNFLSFAVLAIALLFYTNNKFAGPTYVETYEIINFDQNEYETVYILKDNQYENKKYIRSVKQGDEVIIEGNSKLSIYFSDGLFGLRKIEKKLLH